MSHPNGDLSPFMQMLLGFGTVPEWHNLLSSLFIWLITTAFITIPPVLIRAAEKDTQDASTGINYPVSQVFLSEPLYAVAVTISCVGLMGMIVVSRYRTPNQMALKDNYFWLYHKYYQRVAEGGIYGLVSLLVSIKVLGNGSMDGGTIAVICITGVVTALFTVLAGWAYFKTRRTRKAHELPQP